MNRKWIYRAMTAAVAVGGMLLFGAASANASTQVAGADKPAALVNSGGVTHPVMVQHDPASQLGQLGLPITGGFMHPDTVRPGAAQPGGTFNESAGTPEGLPGISTGNPPTNGTKVDVPQLTGAAAPVVKPVQQLAGPAAGPLSGLTGTEAAGGPTDLADPSGLPVVGPLLSGATQGQQGQDQQQPAQQAPAAQPAAPTAQQPTGEVGPTDGNTTESASLPLGSAPLRAVPVLGTEDGFTIGQNNQLPTDGLVSKAGSGLGSTVGKLTGGPSLSGLPGTESATEGSPVDSLAGGANLAGLPVGDLTGPVTSQLGGLPGQEDTMQSAGNSTAPTGTAPAGSAPANPDQPTNGGAPGLGSDPLSTVTGLVGGLGA